MYRGILAEREQVDTEIKIPMCYWGTITKCDVEQLEFDVRVNVLYDYEMYKI